MITRARARTRARKRGFEVVSATSGAEALQILASQPVDLVLLDVTMPGMSGLDVLRELRKTRPAAELPVIMATARAQSEHVVEALGLGANDYVTKPIDLPVLHARIVATLRATVRKPRRSHSDTLDTGTVLDGRYVLESRIGEGGFGTVYRGQHRELRRPVAVKVLRARHVEGESVARLRREGVNACRVQHPNAVAVLDSGIAEDGVAYLVTEMLDGHTLEHEMSTSWLSFARCAAVLAPVCEALAAAHAVGVSHRDIKPGNVFLHRAPTGEEIPKVLDFGIAKLVGAGVLEQRITVEGWLVGTPAYMAPGRFGLDEYDGKSDIYAVGVLLHQLISGDVPFSALPASGKTYDDPIKLATMHAQLPPPPLRQLEPDTPVALEALVLAALAKRPEDRPTATELAHALREAVLGAPETRSLMSQPARTRARKIIDAALPTLQLRSGTNEGGE